MNSNQQTSDSPLVSVIIPAYNAEAFIEQTLESVLSQTYRNIEVLVVDDGSKDQTAEIVKSFAQKDEHVTLLQQANAGVAAARNLAIEKSRGEYIAPIDADDIWYPQNLEKQVQCMLEAGLSVGLVYAWSVYVDEQGLPTGGCKTSKEEGEVYISLVSGNFIGSASAPLIRRACFEQVGGYNSQLRAQNAQGCEDWDLYLRIAEHYQFRVVPEFLIGYRQVIGSMSCNYAAMAKSHQLTMADAQRRNPEIPAKIYRWSRSSYYLYLAHQSRRCGYHWSSLFWTYKALKLEPVILLNNQLYKPSLISLLKLIARPLTSLIWSNHISWLRFKRQLKPNRRVMNIADLNKRVSESQQLPKSLYHMIWSQRWTQFIENSPRILSQEREQKLVKN